MTDAHAPPIKPGSDDHKVLEWLRCSAEPDYMCFGFATIMDSTELDRRRVRLACRRLARKGLTFYARALTDEASGEMRGAGYGITRAGYELAEQMAP